MEHPLRPEKLFRSLSDWPEALRSYADLEATETRTVGTGRGRQATLMFNPARVRSTAAKVDTASVSLRPCFLCRPNRPKEQQFQTWRAYEALVNPYPIFRRHLTIASKIHEPQTLANRMGDMTDLAMSLPGYAVFYNGGRCGASAPDHMHFQAADELAHSTVLDAILSERGKRIDHTEELGAIYASEGTGRLAYHFSVPDGATAQKATERLMSMRRMDYDMINVAVRRRKDADTADIVVVPRRAFRPWQYDADGDRRIMVSPATVEVLGVFVLPRREDYEKMSEADVDNIVEQVCYATDNELIAPATK